MCEIYCFHKVSETTGMFLLFKGTFGSIKTSNTIFTEETWQHNLVKRSELGTYKDKETGIK
jgi:hypothetical protein